MKKIYKRIIAAALALLLSFSVLGASAADKLLTPDSSGIYFTSKAETQSQGEAVYNVLMRQTTNANAQRIYNLMFKAKYRVTDFGGTKWCKNNLGDGISSVTDSGLKSTVYWGKTAWGCCSYAYFCSMYSRGTIGEKVGLCKASKPDVNQLKQFITDYADPGEHIRFYYCSQNYSSIHSIVYLAQDADGFYFLSENGNRRDIRLYYITYNYLQSILRKTNYDYPICIFDTNGGKDEFYVTASLTASSNYCNKGQSITFYMSGINSGSYDFKIYSGSVVDFSTTVNGSSYTYKCEKSGVYTASITAYSSENEKYTATSKLGFTVYNADLSKVVRIAGSNRIQTAAKICDEGWAAANSAQSATVIIANGYSFADALAGSPLAYALDAPILLTANGATLEKDIKERIEALNAQNVIILGGKSAVSESTENQLVALGCSVERISGANRYETAVAIACKLAQINGEPVTEIFVASGKNYPDALAVSPVAAIKRAPILFSDSTGRIDESVLQFVTQNTVSTAVILGGTVSVGASADSALSDMGIASVSRIYGVNRYVTAQSIVASYSDLFSSNGAVLVTGSSFPDALAGGVLAAKNKYPVFLTSSSTASAYVSNYLNGVNIKRIYVLGGTNAVSEKTVLMHFGI